jgi:hypothetical protein
MLAGKTVTFSFWAYTSSGSGATIAVEMVQDFGTGGSPSAAVTGIGAQTVSLVPTLFKRYSVTINVPNLQGKTLGTNGDTATQIGIWLSAGSNYAARASNIGLQNGFYVSFWGMQLEVGSAASPLELRSTRYELAECQRYYVPYGPLTFAANASAANFDCIAYVNLPVTMRSVPQVSAPTLASSPAAINVSSVTTYNVTPMSFQVSAVSTSSGYTGGLINAGYCSSELPII